MRRAARALARPLSMAAGAPSATTAQGARAAAPLAELFQAQSVDYARFRPSYPPALFREIFSFFDQRPVVDSEPLRARHALAVDVATGTGQAVPPLAARFDRVLGLDAAPAQVAAAVPCGPHVDFRVATAEATGVPTGAADLVTTAQAMHWFDLEPFYAEMTRVLRPGGAFAGIGYANPVIAPPAANDVVDHFYNGTLGAHWHPFRRKVEAHFVGLEPPVVPAAEAATRPGFEVVERVELTLSQTVPLQGFVGYLGTWSAYHTLLKTEGIEKGSGRDPLVAVARELEAIVADLPPLRATPDAPEADALASIPGPRIRVDWPLFAILARRNHVPVELG